MADTYFWRSYLIGGSPPAFGATSLLNDGTEPDHSTRASGNVGSEDCHNAGGDLIEQALVNFNGTERVITSVRFTSKAIRISGLSAGVAYSVYAMDSFGAFTQLATGSVSNNGFTDASVSVGSWAFGILVEIQSLTASLPPVTDLSLFDLRYDGYYPFGSVGEGYTAYRGPFGSVSQGVAPTLLLSGSISQGFMKVFGYGGSVSEGYEKLGGGGSVSSGYSRCGSGGSVSSSFNRGSGFGSVSQGFNLAGNGGSVSEGYDRPSGLMGSVSQGYALTGNGGSVSEGYENVTIAAPTSATVNFFPVFSGTNT